MTALDRTVWVHKDGTIIMRTENDGWSFLNSGPEARERVITIAELKRDYPSLYAVYLDGPDHPNRNRFVYWTKD